MQKRKPNFVDEETGAGAPSRSDTKEESLKEYIENLKKLKERVNNFNAENLNRPSLSLIRMDYLILGILIFICYVFVAYKFNLQLDWRRLFMPYKAQVEDYSKLVLEEKQ